ncbi:uncharacterized protein MICPUCDRAFT_54503 [Micromonas pusilla CCMP1545]|uniref:Predicted protein n=1 Tax=Micromonas pusilla (strain CCMP1545) TaxID=564608 RepID=C1N9H2_MICPC|nr:uncharacterized protein MICPUCDRAFT_54503 [Micromonas pusilla CCMP1545]EEH51523.1 predicted protein [Micromonas pusilla CCMP1545]|eukprot:XP_003064618.1 predicted protein [Micromonas pusilla CCMP1545]
MGEGYKRGHDGGGGGGGHRKKGKWFGHVVSNAAIPYGAAGVVVTCDKGKEKHAVRDVIRYVNESYETLVPSARRDERHDERKNKSEGDVSDALEAELRALKEEGGDGDGKVEGGDGDTERRPSRDRFKALKLDFRACAFIQARPRSITLMDAEAAKKCPPSALVRHLLTRTKTEGYPRSRHAMRIVPVDAVCFAGMEEIKKAVEPFVAKHFPAGAKEEEKKTFAIQARSYISFDRFPASRRNTTCAWRPPIACPRD